MTITPIIAPRMFTGELGRLTFGSFGGTLNLTVSVGGDRVLAASYRADSSGSVTVYALDRLIERRIADICAEVEIVANGERMALTAFACAGQISEPAETFLTDFFLTPVMHERDTAIGRHELLTACCPGGEAVCVDCTYLRPDGLVTTRRHDLAELRGVSSVDVSPGRFAVDGLRLVSYRVRCGCRRASYRVRADLRAGDPELLFRNRFRAFETFSLTGTRETSTSINRSQALIGGRLVTYDVETVESHKAMTGPLRHGTEASALDLAMSAEVWLLNGDGSPGAAVTLTGSDTGHTNEDSALANFTITYRIADRRNLLLDAVRPPRIFDKTFDESFE